MLCRVLAQYGIEKERVHLTYISAAEGEKFARVSKELTDKLRELGPLNWKDNWRMD